MAIVSKGDLERLIAAADVGDAAADRLRHANEPAETEGKARGHGASRPSTVSLPEM